MTLCWNLIQHYNKMNQTARIISILGWTLTVLNRIIFLQFYLLFCLVEYSLISCKKQTNKQKKSLIYRSSLKYKTCSAIIYVNLWEKGYVNSWAQLYVVCVSVPRSWCGTVWNRRGLFMKPNAKAHSIIWHDECEKHWDQQQPEKQISPWGMGSASRLTCLRCFHVVCIDPFPRLCTE